MQSIEVAARDYVNNSLQTKALSNVNYEENNYEAGYNDSLKDNTEEAFKAGVEFAQQWISVKDELPELTYCPSFNHYSDIILLKNKSGTIFSGYYNYDLASFFDYIDNVVSGIIEWRPIE